MSGHPKQAEKVKILPVFYLPHTMITIRKLKFTIPQHPPPVVRTSYSLTSICLVPHKKLYQVKRFVPMRKSLKLFDLCSEGIRELPKIWRLYVQKEGEYVEK